MRKFVTAFKAVVFGLGGVLLLLYQSMYQIENINLLIFAVMFILIGEINTSRLDRYNE